MTNKPLNYFHFFSLLILLFLTACDGGNKQKGGVVSSRYSNYMSSHPKWRPPGPEQDPWGPYINQSSQRFNVPDQWIRAVMMQESRGYQYYNKRPITSPHGAKGLMQLKTPTYNDMAKRYNLGKDPYDPRDNIMAGTAYIRILYNKFGAPGFVAAYHGGPGTLNAHLTRGKSLPSETKKYLAAVAPKLGNDVPMSGPFASYAGPYRRKNTAKPLSLEAYYTPKPYYPTTMVAQSNPVSLPKNKRSKSKSTSKKDILVASSVVTPTYEVSKHSDANIVQVAYAPPSSSKGNWGIQVGAFSSPSLAQQATFRAKRNAAGTLSIANSSVEMVNKNGNKLYRARLTGINYITASEACSKLKQKGMNCVTIQ
ncbi:lytic transglycosylase domain-containing protein [Commensalibacter oyaizuii]|uniref:Lytic transglycosylase domain-containing protein n=1 Tax=Commensalibacter oyaizuii TaxID=3043873 RepID=A0ABT6Q380_9PROT|nr:lytic transglycosylase domain-containing protein [Commensalibacter sp. TBRC 16381]MDI2091554.1 lytic transglycosylase domain-containing protein [Commensalibacter sp. TBRC 16381]